jgi:IS605 OrfB family transposase
MKAVVQIKLLADASQLDTLTRTLWACNETATFISAIAHQHQTFRERDLRAISYAQARQHADLASQAAQSCIRKVAASYKALHGNLRNGQYGEKDSKRRVKVENTPIVFRPLAAQPFDDRCLSWQHADGAPARGEPAGTVSIWTVDGRLRGIPFAGCPEQVAMLRAHRRGEADLVVRHGRDGRRAAYLIATLDIPEPLVADGPHLDQPDGWIGVDMGIENIAVTSDRALAAELMDKFGCGAVSDRRARNRTLRRKLQRKGTKSAKRLLKKRSRKEARFGADVNHQVSKKIVAEAERTGRGIAVEELTGIRERVRLRKPQRATHSSWAFAQLGSFLAYKSAQAGVPFTRVDPAYTSQRCTACGYTSRRNRTKRAEFVCKSCGFAEHADILGSDNIAYRAPETYRALSTVPSVA